MNKQKPPASCCWLTPVALGAAFFATPVGWAIPPITPHAPPTEFYRLAYSSIPAGRIAEGVGLMAG